MTLNDALDWFGLDPMTVNEASLKEAYRNLAKEFHPDTKHTYVDKKAAHENFVAAGNANNKIAEALIQGILPRAAGRVRDDFAAFDQNKDEKNFGFATKDEKYRSYEDTLTGREKYDFHNPRPLERLMGLPVIGPIISVIVGCGMLLGVIAGFCAVALIFVPFQVLALVYLLLSSVLEIFGLDLPEPEIKWDRLWDMAEGLPLFLLYYVLTFVGALIFAKGDEDIFIYLLAPMWLAITLMALDEIYSAIRYVMIARRFKSQVAAAISEED